MFSFRRKVGCAVLGAGSIAIASLTADRAECRPERPNITDLRNATVMVTGSTGGIGEATAWRFADTAHCGRLVLTGRREEKLKEMKREIEAETRTKVAYVLLDVRDRDQCLSFANKLPPDFRDIDVLVNNAGVALNVQTIDTNLMDDVDRTMQTNVMSILYLCRAIVPGMKARNRGHIINIGSIAGHMPYSNGTIYNASKFAVHGMTTAARMDLIDTPIRVTHISPGMVGGTDFSLTRFGGTDNPEAQAKAAKVYDNIVPLGAADVADNVVYAATRPAHCQVTELTMLATNQCGPKDVARVGASLGAK